MNEYEYEYEEKQEYFLADVRTAYTANDHHHKVDYHNRISSRLRRWMPLLNSDFLARHLWYFASPKNKRRIKSRAQARFSQNWCSYRRSVSTVD